MIVIVAGIPGSGKTTVMKKVIETCDTQLVTYGTVMFEIAKEKTGVTNRDEMRKLPPLSQKEFQEMAAERIAKMKDVVVDTHCTIKTKAGFLPGLPKQVLQKLSPQAIVLVEAYPDEIIQRRQKDTRERDREDREEIEQHQFMNRVAAMSYAAMIGATVKIVKNHDKCLDGAVAEVLEMLNEKG
jgi:adenylate kinase